MNPVDSAQLFEVLPSPHMILDRDLRYVAVNRAYEEAVMRERGSMVGRKLFDLFPNEGESGRRLLASLLAVFETGEKDTLAYIPYEIPRPPERGGGMEQRYWTAIHTPLRGPDGAVSHVLQNTVDVTEIARLRGVDSLPLRGTMPGEVALLQRAQEVEEAYQETASESAEFRRLFQQAPGMIAVMQGPDHVFTFVNDSYLRFVGRSDVVGKTVRKVMPEVKGQGFFDLLDDVYRSGRTHGGEGVPVLLCRHDAVEPSEFFMDFTFNPIRNAAGAVSGVFVQGADRTDSVRAARRQRVLIDELNHRVKNTLATVQSIARQSFRDGRDPAAARYAFEARLLALSKAHNVLSDRKWEAADLSVLLRQELAVFDPARVRISGPQIHLGSKAAIALAMVFHELAVNAAQYGALASAGGRLEVEWRQSFGMESRFDLSWREIGVSDGPADITPGFGLKLLQKIIEGELDGRLDLDFDDDGLICRFQLSSAEIEDAASSAA